MHLTPRARARALDIAARVLFWLSSAMVLGTMVLIIYSLQQPDDELEASAISLMVVSILLSGAASLIRKWGNRYALELALENARADQRAPFLLLRSFTETCLWYADRTRFLGRGRQVNHRRNLVEALAAPKETRGPVLALGDEKPDSFDSNPLADMVRTVLYWTPDRLWEVCFDYLVMASRAVIVIPGTTPGIIRELESLSQLADDEQIKRRIVVIMTPATDSAQAGRLAAEDERSLQESWERIRKHLRKHKLELPEYHVDGMLYVPKRDFSVHRSESLGRGNEAMLADRLEAFLGPPEGDLPSTADVLARLDELTRADVPGSSASASPLDPPPS